MKEEYSDKLSKLTFITTLFTCALLVLVVFFFILPPQGKWMIEHYLPRASSFAGDIDWLFNLITFIVGVWFVIAEGVLFWFIFKFRRRPGVKADYLTGENKEHKKWISVPHALVILCDVVLIAGTIMVWYQVKQNLPPADRVIRVTGQQWAWIFQHPGPDGQLDTGDDITKVDELHLESGLVYHFELQAKDVLHSFSIPVFRLKQDAVPGRVIKGWFKPVKEGNFDIQCAEMCGIGHGLMGAHLTIATADDHQAWMASQGMMVAALDEGAAAASGESDASSDDGEAAFE